MVVAKPAQPDAGADETERGTWGSPIEFLMSCIAMSVGLGMLIWWLSFPTHFEYYRLNSWKCVCK